MAAEVTAKLKLDADGFREGVRQAQSGFARFQSDLNKRASAVGKELAPVAKGLAAIGVAAAAAGAATTAAFGFMVKDGLALNSQLEQATTRFTAFTKDAKMAKDIVAALRTEADVTPFDTGEMIQAGAALVSSAKGSREELMKLVKTAEVLAALNPAQGLQGAAFAIREAMGGDFVSLQSRFDISRNAIKELKSQGKDGVDLINAALKQMGAGPELVTKLAGSFEGLKSTALSTLDNIKQIATAPLFDVLKDSLAEFTDYLDDGAREDMQEFASIFGEEFGKAAKGVFTQIKNIDWAEVGKGATAMAEALGEAAASAAALVASMPDTSRDVGIVKNRAKAVGLGISANIASITGDDERAKELRLEQINATLAGTTAMGEAYGKQEEYARKTRVGMFSSINTDEVVKNWLKTRGKTEADVKGNSKIQRELLAKFGPDALLDNPVVGGTGYTGPFNTGQAAKEARAARGGARPLPVEVYMAERNPTHNVMSV